MPSIFQALVDIVYVQERNGPGTPKRIVLPSALFAEFQADVRQRAADLGIEAIYPGAVLGVPVVESADQHARLTAADGSVLALALNNDFLSCSQSEHAHRGHEL